MAHADLDAAPSKPRSHIYAIQKGRYESESHHLARARLRTVDGYGHTVFSNPSTCAMEYETRYLLTGCPSAGRNRLHAGRHAFPEASGQ